MKMKLKTPIRTVEQLLRLCWSMDCEVHQVAEALENCETDSFSNAELRAELEKIIEETRTEISNFSQFVKTYLTVYVIAEEEPESTH